MRDREAKESAWRARGMNVLVARAVDNAVPVVAADVAGRQGERVSHGTTAIIDAQGTVIARAEPLAPGLVVTDVELRRDIPGRGVDGPVNQAVTEAFLALWGSTDGSGSSPEIRVP
jgi:predicted amidohydrolase